MLCLGAALAGPALAEVRIAALGDSLVQGYGLKPDDGLVPQLNAWLEAHGVDATVLNAGVSGDTSAGGLARADWTLTDDVDGLILALGGNDLLRGIDPAVTRQNLGAILSKAQEKGIPTLLVGIRAPGNYGPQYKQQFDAIYPDLARDRQAQLYPGFFEALTGSGRPAGELMQPDGIHPSAEGVAVVVADFGPAVAEFVKAVEARQ